MRVKVAFLPAQVPGLHGDVCIVVDVIRASTAIVSLFEAGCSRVFVSRSRADATRARAKAGDDSVICAEQDDGSAPAGYDHEPSPSVLSALQLAGRSAVLATANGTPAILIAHREGAGCIMVGSLRNLDAVAALAYAEARARGADITVICSGQLRNSRVAIEDVYCAGAIAMRLQALADGDPVILDDDAAIAHATASAATSPRDLLIGSMTGQRFIDLGKKADVVFCAETNVSTLVPLLVGPGQDVACPVHVLDD